MERLDAPGFIAECGTPHNSDEAKRKHHLSERIAADVMKAGVALVDDEVVLRPLVVN